MLLKRKKYIKAITAAIRINWDYFKEISVKMGRNYYSAIKIYYV